MGRDPEPRRMEVRVPFNSLDTLLRSTRLDRQTYLKGRKAIKSWHESTIGKHVPISMSTTEETTMKFVDRQLTQEDMLAAFEWCDPEDVKLSIMVNECLREGYRITFSYDVKEDFVTVTLMGKSGANPNHDLGMSTRHDTVRTTLHLAMYKQYVLYENGAWGESSRNSRLG